MAVITFVNNIKEETGKTMSLVGIATYMAINQNNKVLILSTTDRKDRVDSCFFVEQKAKKRRSILGTDVSNFETETGIEGLVKIIRSNKLTPDIINNYAKVVFREGRLDVISGSDSEKLKQEAIRTNSEIKPINEEYITLINVARSYYDMIFVDLDENITKDVQDKIIEISDLVMVNTSQNFTSIDALRKRKEEDELLQSPKSLILVGKCDLNSKYNVKNITRYLGEKNKVLSVPYNTLFMEAGNEGNVVELIYRFKKLSDPEDKNTIFIQELQRASDAIIYRLKELQARI